MSIRIVVPISGGKDSQATLKLACATHPANEILALFCDTQFEHPLTYAQVAMLQTMYGNVHFKSISAGSVESECYKTGRLPGGGSRFCTKALKIVVTKKYLKALALELGHGFEVWYGMRSGESTQREKRYRGKVNDELYHPHEVLRNYPQYLGKMGVRFRLAILDWTEAEVFEYLQGAEHPHYAAGFSHVGCFPCLAGGDADKERAFAHDDFGQYQKQKVIRIARDIGKDVFESKGGAARNADMQFGPCALHCGI